MYTLRHQIEILSDREESYTPKCNGVTFDNTGTADVTLNVTGSKKVLTSGASLSFTTNHPEVVIMTPFKIEFGSAGTKSLTIYKDVIFKD